MNAILADINITGQVRDLVETFYKSAAWIDFWDSLQIQSFTFAQVGLAADSPDDQVWRMCQARGWVLITGNRNQDGPTSLETTLRTLLKPDSLPVITISRSRSLGKRSDYTAAVGIQLLDYLLNIEKFLGTGRLFVP